MTGRISRSNLNFNFLNVEYVDRRPVIVSGRLYETNRLDEGGAIKNAFMPQRDGGKEFSAPMGFFGVLRGRN